MSTAPVTQDFGWCPCGLNNCSASTKLTKYGHVPRCVCSSCTGRRSRRKGQKAEARAHKRLGGTGPTIRDDLFHCYSVNLSVETKTGATNIPAKALDFMRSKFAADAFGQAIKKIPVGSDAKPTIILEVSPSESYAVVKLDGKDLR